MRTTSDAMQIFASVVTEGSFTQAAKALSLSKAAVSQQVKQLESRLGVKLLNRSTRKLSLTEAGQDYYHSCLRVQSEIRAAEERLAELQGEPKGRLKVTCTANFGTRLIVPAIIAFKQLYPAIAIELLMNDQVQELVADNIDVAFRFGPLAPSQLVARPVLRCPYLLCASPEYLGRRGPPASIEDLGEHNWVIHRLSRHPNRITVGHRGKLEEVEIHGDVVTDNSMARRQFILDGLGIARIAEVDVRAELASGQLQRLMTDHHFGTMELYAVYAERQLMTHKLRLFLDFIQQWFSTLDAPPSPGPGSDG
ncbi:LysR family transcriptional regulator [Ferrimonas sediminicola]|uniref:LysR family transcriptional regulator n=1 Tax=Ferrimonas sediminicola TaxID=2569538 RepID=A0A4U1BB02_9GAMM|nr:LysR family transcriptional regulator [Ferrimonas sediminicola]TKB47348.1 LysR family transcriptional regulator [Ferrimonas sediminicola]